MRSWTKRFLRLLYERDRAGLAPLSKEAYEKRLKAVDSHVAKRAFEKAWEIRNFEIEMYWKRATYFWAFIASALAGYFALVNAEGYRRPDPTNHFEVYLLICLGFILSLAWHLTNQGSKQWQRHWEVHVDLLEDQFTGPLYKTVYPQRTFSVSKINEIVSFAFTLAWVVLGVKFLVEQDLINLSLRINWFVVIATVATLCFASSMLFGYGRGRFGDRAVTMFGRTVTYGPTEVSPDAE